MHSHAERGNEKIIIKGSTIKTDNSTQTEYLYKRD